MEVETRSRIDRSDENTLASSPRLYEYIAFGQHGYLLEFGDGGYGAEEEKSDDRSETGGGIQEAAAGMQDPASGYQARPTLGMTCPVD